LPTPPRIFQNLRVWPPAQWLFDAAFYLPGVSRELAALETPQLRNDARVAVWHRLFANWRYWVLCAIVAAIVSWIGIRGGRIIAHYAMSVLPFRYPFLFQAIWGTFLFLVALIFAFVGMWPIQRLVRREMHAHLRELGYRLCPDCAYDLRAVGGPKCPECGRPQDDWTDLPPVS
jgi:hypothetical protein